MFLICGLLLWLIIILCFFVINFINDFVVFLISLSCFWGDFFKVLLFNVIIIFVIIFIFLYYLKFI